MASLPLKKLNSWTIWKVLSFFFTICVLAPVIALIFLAVTGNLDAWDSLIKYVIPVVSYNTFVLLAGVAIVVGLIGTGSAWITSAYDFPTRKLLIWALLLPLAVPTYIMAFAYLDLLHPLGPIQSIIRDILGYSSPREFRLPDIRGMGGAIFIMGFALYPYVYLSTRVMFMSQSVNLLEASRSLGCSPAQTFRRIVLPMARPAIAVGVSLALLEALNDIGASEFLGVRTLTVTIYNEWVARANANAAAQIAIFMLFVVTLLIYMERLSRQRQRYANTQRLRPIEPQKLKGKKAVLMIILGWLPILVGFVFPSLYLVSESIARLHNVHGISDELIASTINTITLAVTATVVTVIIGLIIAWVARNPHFYRGKIMVRIASLGYAIPGAVLALGLLTPFNLIDDLISDMMEFLFNVPPRLYIMGSTAGLVIAYAIRFLAMSVGSVESGFTRIPLSLDNASASLGNSPEKTFRRVHLPLLRPALGAAALLIFVDAMKELSATLLLRPLNFETLATWLYAEAVRGTYEEGAIAALLIVLAGIIPVIILARSQLKNSY